MNVGDIYTTNLNGDVEILELINSKHTRVRFLDTNTVTKAHPDCIKKGVVKDHNRPSVYGVGFAGMAGSISKYGKSVSVWRDILKRCYCPRWAERYPNRTKPTVTPEWHSYANFKTWFDSTYLEGHRIKPTSSHYSPTSCGWVISKRRAKQLQSDPIETIRFRGCEYRAKSTTKDDGTLVITLIEPYGGNNAV